MKKSIQSILFLFLLPAVSMTQEIIYPSPAGVNSSNAYEVFVNGKKAFVYDSPVPASYCSFGMNGPVQVVIKAKRDIKWVDIRPRSAGVTPSFKDSTIIITLQKPAQLSIELNGSIRSPLFLFANSAEKQKPDRDSPGLIYFESGKIHYPGIIELQSNQQVYIEAGAIVVGVIKASHVSHIKVSGYGIMDGTFNHRFNNTVVKSGDREKIKSDTAGHYERFIFLDHCNDVLIENITLHNATSWQIVPENCNRVTINNVKIVSDQPSDDGIDIVHSRNVVVSNCFIRVKDDCVVIKAYLDPGNAQNVDSIRVEHNVCWNGIWGNGLEVGFELEGVDVKNILFKDIDLIHVQDGAAMSIHNAGTSTVSNVVFDDIRIEDANQKLVDIAIFRSRYSKDGSEIDSVWKKEYLNGAWDGVLTIPPGMKSYHAGFRGHIRHIRFRNIKVLDGNFAYSIIYGFDEEHTARDILFENIIIHGRKIQALKDLKLYTEQTKNILIR